MFCVYKISFGMRNFEDKLTELKKIVDELKQFEQGTKLIKDCHKQLEEFQKKISILVENNTGEIEFKDFETDQD